MTVRDIAAEVGVSAAAVSLALRNSPQVSEGLRERVREAAERLGWRPNPLLAAYQTQVRALKPVKFQATLGWLNDHPEEKFWETPWNRVLKDGAKARAQALGFALDEIWIPRIDPHDTKGNAMKYRRILLARGIHGVILPVLDRANHAALPWHDFSVACIGRHHLMLERSKYPLEKPEDHHMVNQDDYANTRLAIRKLREAGCRRVGLAISEWEDRSTDGLCSAAYLREASEWAAKERVPVLFSDHGPEVAAWVKKHAPDGVVCAHGDMKRHIEKTGRKVPRDVRVAHLNLAPDVAGWSGIDRRAAQIAAAAVDLVTAQMVRNERGVPPCTKEVLIEGRWVAGGT